VVKNHVEKDSGLYDIAEELVKEMEESQCQMEMYKQPESTATVIARLDRTMMISQALLGRFR
jgi:hypothetical protein